MKEIVFQDIVNKVAALCLSAAYDLPSEVVSALEQAASVEEHALAQTYLDQCLENARIAANERLPICQDTGFAVYFVELGQDVHISGGLLVDAIEQGTLKGYKEGYLRTSIVSDPLYDRKNTGTNTPPVIHISLVSGETLRITLAPKGAGSENISALRMFNPSNGEQEIIRFVIDTIIRAGGNPCPPVTIGIGIGGTFEKAAILAKKALIRPLGSHHPDQRYATLEQTIRDEVNKTGVGAQGFGGTTTTLAVHIETYPCHMASLPVALNINCHAARHATIEL